MKEWEAARERRRGEFSLTVFSEVVLHPTQLGWLLVLNCYDSQFGCKVIPSFALILLSSLNLNVILLTSL